MAGSCRAAPRSAHEREWPASPVEARRVGAGQALLVGEQGQESVALRVRAGICLGLRNLREARGPAEASLGRPDGGCLRVGEDHPRNGIVVGLAWLAENVGCDDLTLVLAHMGQLPDAGNVADRPKALARLKP